MKVLFFSSYFYPHISGLTIYPFRVLKHLSKKHKVTVLTFGNSLEIGNWKLEIVNIPYLFKLSKGFYSPQAKFYFLKYLLKNDIVMLNLPNGEGLLLALLAKLCGKKIISIFHCQVSLPYSPTNKLIEFILKIITNIQLHLSDQIVTNTKDYFDSLHLNKKFLKKTSFVLPPIELKKINNKEFKHFLSFKKNKIWVGYLGRIASEKGIEYLIEAVKILKKRNIEIVFAGQSHAVNEENYLENIKQKLSNNNLSFRFFNKLKENQLAAFYKSLDVFVLPSVNSTESFGMTQCEAMIIGTSVIATNLPGVRIPLKQTKMGILVKPKSSLEIKKAILEILKNRKKYVNTNLVHNAKKIFSPKKTYNFFRKMLISSAC